jgi:hypothetical protein
MNELPLQFKDGEILVLLPRKVFDLKIGCSSNKN